MWRGTAKAVSRCPAKRTLMPTTPTEEMLGEQGLLTGSMVVVDPCYFMKPITHVDSVGLIGPTDRVIYFFMFLLPDRLLAKGFTGARG